MMIRKFALKDFDQEGRKLMKDKNNICCCQAQIENAQEA
jgi:hypothetical protein